MLLWPRSDLDYRHHEDSYGLQRIHLVTLVLSKAASSGWCLQSKHNLQGQCQCRECMRAHAFNLEASMFGRVSGLTDASQLQLSCTIASHDLGSLAQIS